MGVVWTLAARAMARRAGLLLVAVAGFVVLAGMGCTASDGESKPTTAHEQPTPLGCDRAAGHYYDPLTRTCVSPPTATDAYILSSYRYVAQLADANPSSPMEITISFARILPPSELRSLLDELQPTSITYLRLHFPAEGPGITVADHLPGSASLGDAASAVVARIIRQDDPDRTSIVSAVAGQSYGVWLINVLVPPERVLPWWNDHLNDVRLIQPQVTEFDKGLMPLSPGRGIE